jgi:hypothetical protein
MFGTILFSDLPIGMSYETITGDIWDVKCEPPDEWEDKYTPSAAKVDLCEVE